MSLSTQLLRNSHAPNRYMQLLETYRPLVIAGGLVICGTLLLSLVTHQPMYAFMSCFYIVFAAPKLMNRTSFAAAFARYDILAEHFPSYARIYPFIEVLFGAVFLLNHPMSPNLLSIIADSAVIALSVVGILGVVSSLRRKQNIACACLGTAFSFLLSWVSIVENSLMLCMALAMLALHM